jgi:hypothetical protein
MKKYREKGKPTIAVFNTDIGIKRNFLIVWHSGSFYFVLLQHMPFSGFFLVFIIPSSRQMCLTGSYRNIH